LSPTEIGHGDPGQLETAPRCFQLRILTEDERTRVIGFDEPLGKRLVADFVESPEHDDDVGERDFTEGGKLGDRRQPGHGRVWRPPDDVLGEQGTRIDRVATDLGLDRLQQHVLARLTHCDSVFGWLSIPTGTSGTPT
jgi:hypothetical protein